MSAEQRLKELGLVLPAAPVPKFNYVPFRIADGVIYLAGQGPQKADGSVAVGKVGSQVSVEDAYQHARLTGLNLLAVMKAAAGSLDRVEVLKVLGLVNAEPDFGRHPSVINGCSDLFVEVLGERGKHARSAMGMGSLPNGMTVEIECVCRIVE